MASQQPYIVPFLGQHSTYIDSDEDDIAMDEPDVDNPIDERDLQVAKKLIKALDERGYLDLEYYNARHLSNWSNDKAPQEIRKEDRLVGGYYYTQEAKAGILEWIYAALQ